MARKPPVLLALVAVLALGAAPARAETTTLRLEGPTSVAEGSPGAPRLRVVRAPDASRIVRGSGEASATIEVADGDPSDLRTTLGRVVLPAGHFSVTIPLPLVDDDVVEPAKQLVLRIVDPSPGAAVAPEPLTMTVHDDDYEFAVPEVTVREDAGTVVLPLRRGDATRADMTSLRVIGGSADGLSPVGAPVPLPAGDTAPTATLAVANDAVWHGDRRTVLLLNHRRGPAAGIVVHVIDDDPRWTAPWIAPRATFHVGNTLPLRRQLRFAASCDKACLLTADLRLDPGIAGALHVERVVAERSVRLAAGARRSVDLRLDRRALKRLRARRRAAARLVVVASDEHGHDRTVIEHVTLVP